jgi:hypothetical protein
MKNLFLSDLYLALEDLLQGKTNNPRLKLFNGTMTGQLYSLILMNHLEALRGLPPELTGGRPFAEELGQFDFSHDGFGGAFIEMSAAYLRIPDLSTERRIKIETLVKEFATGGLGELTASYPDEAALAKTRQPKLAQYKDLLNEFPLADGRTFYHLVSAQIENGIALDKKMSERSSTEASQLEKSRSGAGRLRGSIIGTLTRCRSSLADELKLKTDLPRSLDAQIFGYFDELDAKRFASQNQDKKTKPEEKPQDKADR